MNNVSIYCILTIKNSLNTLLLPLIFVSQCLPYKTPAVISQHIWTQFSTASLFNLGNILMEPSAMFIVDGSHVNVNAEN